MVSSTGIEAGFWPFLDRTSLNLRAVFCEPQEIPETPQCLSLHPSERICVQTFDRSGTGKANIVALSVTDLNALTFKSGMLKADQQLLERNLSLVLQNLRK
nr:hypothetical protein [uncultured Acidovorax sp.]